MILCIECSQETKDMIDVLVDSGKFGNLSDVVTAAVATLTTLQRQVNVSGGIYIGSYLSVTNEIEKNKSGNQSNVKPEGSDHLGENINKGNNVVKFQDNTSTKIPELFSSIRDTECPKIFSDARQEKETEGKLISLDKWFFGQYNKYLPVIANLRALSRILCTRPTIQIEEAAYEIAREAATLGDYLKEHDKKFNLKRDDALSIAFPLGGEKSEKSILRYANQFIGKTDKKGKINGMLADFKLINYLDDGRRQFALTKPGYNLALISNPILDNKQSKPFEKLNTEEIEFLLEHIRNYLPAEKFAYKCILTAINKGACDPKSLGKSIRNTGIEPDNKNVSDSYFNTQRSGALSRMSDLGLIVRNRQGVYVTYHVTDRGEKLLSAKL